MENEYQGQQGEYFHSHRLALIQGANKPPFGCQSNMGRLVYSLVTVTLASQVVRLARARLPKVMP